MKIEDLRQKAMKLDEQKSKQGSLFEHKKRLWEIKQNVSKRRRESERVPESWT